VPDFQLAAPLLPLMLAWKGQARALLVLKFLPSKTTGWVVYCLLRSLEELLKGFVVQW